MSTNPALTATPSQTTVVFQGEYAFIQREGVLKTSTPTTCHVVTVYDRASEKAFLAHIDDYTSVPDTIQKIVDLFAASRPLEIKLLGGGSDLYSKHQFKEISSILGALSLPFEKVSLKGYLDRPQIIFDGKTGQLTFIEGKKKSEMLEFIQNREYGEFNNFLDRDYASLNGVDIPNFAIKLAVRRESDMSSLLPARICLVKEKEKQILLELFEKILQQDEVPLQMRAFREKNFNFLTRLACSQSEYLPRLAFLLTFKSVFNIDLQDRGKKSGTAFDVAQKMNNIQALELLQKSEKGPLEIVQEQLEAQIGRYGFPKLLLAPSVDGDWNLLFSRVSANPDYSPSFELLRNHLDLLKIDIETALQCAISEFAPNLQQNAANYPLLFRQSAQKPAHFPLLYFLANNRDLLNLDIHAQGKTSGSALDVAIKADNNSAVTFLKKLGLISGKVSAV